MDKKSKFVNFITSKKFMKVIGFVGIYLLVTGISLAIFSFIKKDDAATAGSGDGIRSRIDLSAPKTEVCPINGLKFTKEEKYIWEERRPIAAMIENHADSRPPSGLLKADVIYEIVAEGGITRFLGIFYCGVSAEEVKIAPVRSARVYFIDYASEYGDKPIFMHVGGANDYSGLGDTAKQVRALELLETLGWRVPKGNDFDTTYDSGFPVFWRNYERLGKEVATEHTMVASLDAAFAQAEKRGFGAKNEKGKAWDASFVEWNFIDDKPETPVASDISFKFWDNKTDYDVNWKYDSANNQYLRFNGGKEHIDLEYKQQFAAKNVVILFAKEKSSVDRNMHLYYTTIGEGNALVFQNGIVVKGSWEKDSREERTKFFDAKGKEISFVRGQTWIEIVPAGNEIEY
ncbi:DUF3048 domain-containing protein [Patescibacteria group bacterium]|nr:DUF3048 domain-containing protein [Patescibacteria group bacterium]MBU2036019.1 DUF3048 domain-containing protein [Patescibacteria group bacterium]